MKRSEYDVCNICCGEVLARRVEKACFWGHRLVAIIKDVPAGVCQQCGVRFYKANVLKVIEKQLASGKTFSKRIEIPETRYAA